MPIQYKHISSVPDVKGPSGDWLNSYTKEIDGVYYCFTTRAGVLWRSINQRCDPKQQRFATYAGCTNDFENYQTFTEWCQTQEGYMQKEANGKFWAIDKDLIVYNNKSYSPETCLFVPTRINTLFVSKNNISSLYPCGVIKNTNCGTFKSSINNGTGKPQYLGNYRTPFEAHQAWQRAKIEQIKQVMLDDGLNGLIRSVLSLHVDRIEEDLRLNRETITYKV